MNIPISSVLDFSSTLLDKLFEDKDERNKAKLALLEMEQKGSLLELQTKLQPLVTELSGNWLQRSWRPILMLTFTYVIAHNAVVAPMFGLPIAHIPPDSLPPDMWQVLKIGIGGYVVGRSVEKVAPNFSKK
jgi:hypothetical protein